MQEVFEKIIEKLESEYEDIKEIYKRTKDMSFYFTFQGVNKAIKIVKKESEKFKDGHFGCNTNGEHERCDGCGLANCKSRNKIWFGVDDDDDDTNVRSNEWIPCSDRLPEVGADVLLSLRSLDIYTGFRANTEECFYVEGEGYVKYENVLAWQPLPTPYQPKGE